MDQTLHALGGLLLKGVPTICLLLIVHFYLKLMFFRPLREVLAKRRDSIEGAKESAEEIQKKTFEKAAAIEAQLRKARDEIYQEQEAMRRRWIDEQASKLEEARRQSRELIHQARQELAAEAEAAKRDIAGTTDALADQISRSLLERRAS
ncbi:MAG TPA: ATP synthase F0 subunit B [Bryobacteraceae bacterium]|nr:ATP synthase F0 subunit B [Bryobacteraceae bacterium]